MPIMNNLWIFYDYKTSPAKHFGISNPRRLGVILIYKNTFF